MANLRVKNGAGSDAYLKASGAGTDGDPHIPEHKETSAAAILAALGGTLAVSGTVTASGPLTDTELRASPVPVSGTVTATTGGLTDTQLRASPVPVSGTVTASGPLTDTQLRATPVPVSGTVTASGPLTDTELRASAVPVSLATAPALVAGEAHIGEVGGKLTRASTEFTRPGGGDTNAYTAGDVVSNSTSSTTLIDLANAVRVNGGSGYIVRVALVTDKKSITPRFRVHFFNASDPTVAADNVAHKEMYADAAKRVGYVDLPAMTTATDSTSSDMSRTVNDTARLPVVAGGATRSLYALLETLDAFTPASAEKFTLVVLVDNN